MLFALLLMTAGTGGRTAVVDGFTSLVACQRAGDAWLAAGKDIMSYPKAVCVRVRG